MPTILLPILATKRQAFCRMLISHPAQLVLRSARTQGCKALIIVYYLMLSMQGGNVLLSNQDQMKSCLTCGCLKKQFVLIPQHTLQAVVMICPEVCCCTVYNKVSSLNLELDTEYHPPWAEARSLLLFISEPISLAKISLIDFLI